MWITFRLLLALAAFLAKQVARLMGRSKAGEHNGIPYYQTIQKGKNVIYKFKVGAPLDSNVTFALTQETSFDAFFKGLGLSKEFQTHDPAFDKKVYIACDHPDFHRLLATHEKARRSIDPLIPRYDRVFLDGKTLWLEKKGNHGPDPEDIRLLMEFRETILALGYRPSSFASDPFFWRALMVEGFTWSLAAYSFGGFLELPFHNEDYYPRSLDILVPGLGASALLFTLLMGGLFIFLRGSSKGHRILIESAVLLVLSLPFCGVQAVSDLNRVLDSSEPILVSRTISQVQRREHRTRRGGRSYSYHFHLVPGPGPVPDQVRVTSTLFRSGATGRIVDFRIGPGRLRIPWYRHIQVRDTQGSWTSPLGQD